MRFRLWDRERELDYYLACREEGWLSSHGTMAGFDARAFEASVLSHYRACSTAVFVVMDGEDRAGILELDVETGKADGVGAVPFVYLDADHRRHGRGIQLLQYAEGFYRALGRSKLRLRCAPENETAFRFYQRNGFYKIGMAEDSVVPLYLLERPI